MLSLREKGEKNEETYSSNQFTEPSFTLCGTQETFLTSLRTILPGKILSTGFVVRDALPVVHERSKKSNCQTNL